MKIAAQFAVSLFAMFLTACPLQAATEGKTFDGKWWMNSDYSERSGFVNGFSDCAVWSAHNNAFNTTPEQIVDKITNHLQTHKDELNHSVIEAWQAEAKTIKAPKERTAGETWGNPHWYLNSDWWQGENEESHETYVEGYLSCIQTLLPEGDERYSRPADYYTNNINSYLTAHKSAHKLAIASILQRFQDSNRKATS